jgi:hypothetical protein
MINSASLEGCTAAALRPFALRGSPLRVEDLRVTEIDRLVGRHVVMAA